MNDLELDVKLLRYVALTEREHKEVFSNALHRVIDFCQERIYEEPVLKHLLRMLHEQLACSRNAVGHRRRSSARPIADRVAAT